MVAFWHLGEVDMNPAVARRRKRREKVTAMTLYLFDQKGEWRFADLHRLVQASTRSRLSRTGLGLIMRPYFLDGTLERERISDHGVEVHVWRKP